MSILAFIADLTKSLAWPVTVLALAIVYRRQLLRLLEVLIALIPRVEHAEVAGVKVDLGKSLDRVEKEAKGVLPEIEGDQSSVDARTQEEPQKVVDSAFFDLPDPFAPRLLVMEAWGEVEAATRELLPNDKDLQASSTRALYKLIQMSVLNEREAEIFSELRDLRNQVVHNPNVSVSDDDAQRYLRFGGALARLIRSKIPR